MALTGGNQAHHGWRFIMSQAENNLSDAAPAGFLPRFAAFLIDLALLVPLTYFSGTLLAIVALFSRVGGDIEPINDIIGLLFAAPIIPISLLYLTLGFAVWQTTDGKRLAGLYVVTNDGSELGGGRAFARAVVLVVSAATVVGLVISGIMIAAREDRRGLNDVICGTMVVRR